MDFDFELILAIAFGITFVAWAYDLAFYAPKRRRVLAGMAPEATESLDKIAKSKLADTPRWLLELKSFFVIIAVIFGLRSFVVEPFQIPSESLLPTLQIGDFILVKKYDYGLRLPVLNTTLIATNEPKRGDVVVFKYPEDPSVNYIKRMIGLPGDVISYHNKRLMVNGELVGEELLAELPHSLSETRAPAILYQENLFGVKHQIYKSYRHNPLEGDWVVPQGHYFVMGDNRDNSADSRVWGFVPEGNLKGRAFCIWLHWNDIFSLPSFKNNGFID